MKELIKRSIGWNEDAGLGADLRARAIMLLQWLNLSRMIDTPIVLRMLSLGERDLVLDVACGTGQQLRRIARKVPRSVGMDIDFDSVRLGRWLAHRGRVNNIDWASGDALRLPFMSETFDKVLCNCSLEHIPNDVCVLAEIGRVLKPGSDFVFTVPHEKLFENSRWFEQALSKWPKRLKKVLLEERLLYSQVNLHEATELVQVVEELQRAVKHERVYSLDELEEKLAKHGLVVREYAYYEQTFGRFTQQVKYAIRFGRGAAIAPLLWLIASLDKFLPPEQEGAGLAIKGTKI